MDQDKLASALRQIKAVVDEALGEVGREERVSKKAAPRAAAASVSPTSVTFNMNVLAFMNRYARGLTGPQKFALLLARLVKGNISQQLPRAEVEKHWNKMKGVLGGKFNPAHANRAKAKGWVDTPKHGIYTLSDSWKKWLARK
jgi:hypothetical protein